MVEPKDLIERLRVGGWIGEADAKEAAKCIQSLAAENAALREKLAERENELGRIRNAVTNPPVGALRRACDQIDWCRDKGHESFRDVSGKINLDARHISGVGTSIGEDMGDAIRTFFSALTGGDNAQG